MGLFDFLRGKPKPTYEHPALGAMTWEPAGPSWWVDTRVPFAGEPATIAISRLSTSGPCSPTALILAIVASASLRTVISLALA